LPLMNIIYMTGCLPPSGVHHNFRDIQILEYKYFMKYWW
jgi:hypothetical protein